MPWLTLADVHQLRDGTRSVVYDTSEKVSLTGIRHSSAVPHPVGTVAMSRTASVGFSCIMGTTMATSQDFVTWTCGDRLDNRFLLWAIRGDRAQILSRMQGSTHKTIYMPDLEDLRISLPPPAEQRAIADYLDAETARIDALIAKKQQLIHLLEERWRAAAETTMNELGAACGWAPLKRFVKCLDGDRIPLSGEERSLRQGDFPYYGASGVIDRVDDYLFNETLVLLGEDGAQLADPDCEISFVVSGHIWVNNHAHVLRPLGSDPSFLALHLSTLDRGSFISGATREKITQDDMNGIPIPNCTLGAQNQAAERVCQIRAGCDALVAKLGRQIDLLAEHRQALITAAVTGEFSVPGAPCQGR